MITLESKSHTYPSKVLLDGRWIDTGRRMQIVSPWTGQVVGEVSEAGAAEAHAAGAAARAAMPQMRALTAAQRSSFLRTIAQTIAARAEEFASIIRDEVGKPMWLCRSEVQRAVKTFLLAAEETLRMPGEIVYPDQETHGAGMVGRIQYSAAGPVLAITPFNFPLNLIAHKVAPALAAGCTVVVKPPPQGPTAALLLGEVVLQSGFPAGALQVLPGGLEAGQALCSDDAFAIVSFTGSAKAGWAIKKNALARQKVLLELGGNAAMIVDDSADLDAAAKAASLAGYMYSGQICISTQRVFVHRAVAERFKEKLLQTIRTEAVFSADPAAEKALGGPLIDVNAANRVEQWTASALKHGASALISGERRGERLIAPWLLENVPASEPLWCEEVFGPVVAMTEAASFNEAIAGANASRYGLQGSVFTQSLANAEQACREMECGAVLVNVPTVFRIDASLYGGVKDSGLGREGVREVIRAFCEPKLFIVKP